MVELYSLAKAMIDRHCILEEARTGGSILLTREDKPVAALLSVEGSYGYLRRKGMGLESKILKRI